MTDAHKIYTAWTQMWNGHLDIADELLSPHFKAHLTADSTPPPAPVTDIASAKAWIATIRAKADLHYELVLGPFCDGDMISAYWRVTATLGGKTAVKVGTDFLKVKDGKITDCWTMNNNTTRSKSVV